jgi:hypothetical protein
MRASIYIVLSIIFLSPAVFAGEKVNEKNLGTVEKISKCADGSSEGLFSYYYEGLMPENMLQKEMYAFVLKLAKSQYPDESFSLKLQGFSRSNDWFDSSVVDLSITLGYEKADGTSQTLGYTARLSQNQLEEVNYVSRSLASDPVSMSNYVELCRTYVSSDELELDIKAESSKESVGKVTIPYGDWYF